MYAGKIDHLNTRLAFLQGVHSLSNLSPSDRQGCWRRQTNINLVSWKRSVRWISPNLLNIKCRTRCYVVIFCEGGAVWLTHCGHLLGVPGKWSLVTDLLYFCEGMGSSIIPYMICSESNPCNHALVVEGVGRLAQRCRAEGGSSEVCGGAQWGVCWPGAAGNA